MKRAIAILVLVIISASLWAQTVDQIKADPNYLYGEGWGVSLREADNGALSSIISQISVTVEDILDVESLQKQAINSSSKQGRTELSENIELAETVKSVLKTYSSATLSNTRRVIIENEPDAHVFRYIHINDVDRIFDARKNTITTLLEEAQEALNKRQINDALRYYYWSHVLVKSLRYPNEMFAYDDRGEKQIVSIWIPKRINEIFDNLDISVSDRAEDHLRLSLLYKGERVNSIDYTFFNGQGWSNMYSGQDGEGIVELRKNFDQNTIRLKVEYVFAGDAIGYPEVKEMLAITPEVAYRKAFKLLNLDEPKTSTQSTSVITTANDFKPKNIKSQARYSYPELTQLDDITPYQKVIDKVLIGVMLKDDSDVANLFTDEGLRAYKKLISYGSTRIVDASIPKYYRLGDNVYCRNILMQFDFKNNNRFFMENVVFEFDKNKKISNVTFGLSRQSTDDIFAKDYWPEAARIILIHFLEGYKSAYALKQIEYIENVFAEDALIITGSYTRKATTAEMNSISTKYVQYTKHTKSEYVRKLRNIFSSNEYININFTNTDLIKAGKGGEIYGIQIKQEYNSSNYGDTGYLFLLVDLNDLTKPTIHVRTWQPEKDPKFGVYGVGNF